MNFNANIENKSNEELLEIYKNESEYQPEFLKLVNIELVKRNIDISEYKKGKEVNTLLQDQKIAAGTKGDPLYIIIGFISALLGGVLGIAAGSVYSFSKETDSKGDRHYHYDLETRKKGHKMLFTGIVVFLATLMYKLGI